MTNLEGKSIGRYHIIEQLGEGGMATVYKAFDTTLERTVAVKVILPGEQHSEKFLQRFKREARALASLSHQNIVKVLDFGEQDGLPYLVMEYVPGGTLKAKLGHPIPYQEAARLLAPIARALEHAHRQNIIHRDVKPANILIDEYDLPKLSDFGVAKVLESEETLDLTGTGVGIGTPDYMAPEQGYGRGVDGRSDIYALGNVLYEMITGHKPYRADTPMAILLMKATEPLPRPSKYVPGLPESVEYMLIKALARQPQDRYQTMEEFARVLERLAVEEKPTPREADTIKTPTGPRSAPRWKWAIAAGIGGVFACTVMVAASIILVKRFLPVDSPIEPSQSPTETSSLATSTETITTEPPPSHMPSATPTVSKPDSYVSLIDGMEMLYVPAGDFLIGVTSNDEALLFTMCPGCPRDLFQDAPQRTIYLEEFWMDKTEVTNEQFAQFVNATGYVTTAERQGWSLVFNTGGNYFYRVTGADWQHPRGQTTDLNLYSEYPVIHVSWDDANAYCEWAGRRLPTEVEWEKAARGIDGRIYPWGNEPPDSNLLNYGLNENSAVEVGSYPQGKSPYGILDMAGNVWEWASWYYLEDYYVTMPDNDPAGPTYSDFVDENGDGYRVIAGGSWAASRTTELAILSPAYRYSTKKDNSGDHLGFRCVSDHAP